jgi:hypothetical protein
VRSQRAIYRDIFLQYQIYIIITQLVTRSGKAFTIFIPSRRKIEFLQKNITQLNVEFKEINVADHE